MSPFCSNDFLCKRSTLWKNLDFLIFKAKPFSPTEIAWRPLAVKVCSLAWPVQWLSQTSPLLEHPTLQETSTPIFTRGIKVLSSAICTLGTKPGHFWLKKIVHSRALYGKISDFLRHLACAFFTTNHSRPAHGWWCKSRTSQVPPRSPKMVVAAVAVLGYQGSSLRPVEDTQHANHWHCIFTQGQLLQEIIGLAWASRMCWEHCGSSQLEVYLLDSVWKTVFQLVIALLSLLLNSWTTEKLYRRWSTNALCSRNTSLLCRVDVLNRWTQPGTWHPQH